MFEVGRVKTLAGTMLLLSAFPFPETQSAKIMTTEVLRDKNEFTRFPPQRILPKQSLRELI